MEDIALNPPAIVVDLFDMADYYATAAEEIKCNQMANRDDKGS